MKKFMIRNDDVAFDTELDELQRFCDICDKYEFTIIQGLVPIGECRKANVKMTNDQIKATAGNVMLFDHYKLMDYLIDVRIKNNDLTTWGGDFFAVHGLWHTHNLTEMEVRIAKDLIEFNGIIAKYFIPPFNEGKYPKRVADLEVCQLDLKKGERLEDFLKKGTPTKPIMYLHSWRFDGSWYTYQQLEDCLKRLCQEYEN